MTLKHKSHSIKSLSSFAGTELPDPQRCISGSGPNFCHYCDSATWCRQNLAWVPLPLHKSWIRTCLKDPGNDLFMTLELGYFINYKGPWYNELNSAMQYLPVKCTADQPTDNPCGGTYIWCLPTWSLGSRQGPGKSTSIYIKWKSRRGLYLIPRSQGLQVHLRYLSMAGSFRKFPRPGPPPRRVRHPTINPSIPVWEEVGHPWLGEVHPSPLHDPCPARAGIY